MRIPAKSLIQPWPDSESPPLLETVFRVLRAVATGSNSSSNSSQAHPSETDVDPTVDNIGEHLSTLSPQPSPVSSPMKEAYNQKFNTKTSPAPGENEANIRSVRLAARMVGRNTEDNPISQSTICLYSNIYCYR